MTQISDRRGNVAVSSQASRLVVTGPIRLLHANYDRRAGLVFSKTVQQGPASPDCSNGVPVVGWDGESDLMVSAGETLCASSARAVQLSWHGRSGLDVVAEKEVQHASNR
jgi:hypothetical protein